MQIRRENNVLIEWSAVYYVKKVAIVLLLNLPVFMGLRSVKRTIKQSKGACRQINCLTEKLLSQPQRSRKINIPTKNYKFVTYPVSYDLLASRRLVRPAKKEVSYKVIKLMREHSFNRSKTLRVT